MSTQKKEDVNTNVITKENVNTKNKKRDHVHIRISNENKLKLIAIATKRGKSVSSLLLDVITNVITNQENNHKKNFNAKNVNTMSTQKKENVNTNINTNSTSLIPNLTKFIYDLKSIKGVLITVFESNDNNRTETIADAKRYINALIEKYRKIKNEGDI